MPTAIATSATGFAFPFNGVLPSHIVGVIALLVLLGVIVARYVGHLKGACGWIYAVGIVISVYFLVFVAIAQAFLKIAVLKSVAPTSTEPPFVAAQSLTLILFIVLAILFSLSRQQDFFGRKHR